MDILRTRSVNGRTTMELNAMTYHADLTDEERAAVNAWLCDVFGTDWRDLRIWRYQVVGEGLVEFHRFILNDETRTLVIAQFWRDTATPPPVLRDCRASDERWLERFKHGKSIGFTFDDE